MGEYNKSAIIKYTRMACKMTQEELAEGICNPETLSRYENGNLNPSNDNFMRLMERMRGCGKTFLVPVECETNEINQIMNDLLFAIEKNDWELGEQIKNRIENEYCFSMRFPENQQYLGRFEIIKDQAQGKIDLQTAILKMEQLLRLTLKYDAESFPLNKILRETEILIIFNLATYYFESGNSEKSLLIFHRLDEYFQRKDMTDDDKPRYLVYLEYANILGLSGRYDESIAVCLKEIQWLLKQNKTNYLYNFYFNIGWNIKKKIDCGLEKIDRIPEAKCYVWLAYQFCAWYPESTENLKLIKKFYDEM